MVQTRVKRALLCAAITAAGVLSAAGSAQAAVYTGRWDPAYGDPFDDLGWNGTVEVNVPDSCIGVAVCKDPTLTLLSATLDFVDLSTNTVFQEFDYTTAQLADVKVSSVNFSGTQLTGVNSGFFDPVTSTNPIAEIGGQAFNFSLSLGSAGAQLVYSGDGLNATCIVNPDPGSCGKSATTGVVTYAPIPEPGTNALMLAGLGVIGFLALRRPRWNRS